MKILLISLALFLSACAGTGPERPVSEISRQAALESYSLALKAYRSGNTMTALQQAQHSIEQDPKNWRAHELLGLVAQKLGRRDTADTHFQQALRINPADPGLLNNYGTALCQRKEFAAAEENFRLAAQNPANTAPEIATLNTGLCSAQAGDMVKARRYYSQAAELAPNNPTVRYQLAKLLLQEGDALAANESLQHYLDHATHTPKSLLLGAKIETALENTAGVASYIQKLEAAFPNSPELNKARALQPPEQSPADPASLDIPSSLSGRDWVLARSPGRYTIYVMNSKSEDELHQLTMAGLRGSAAIFETRRQGNTSYHLITGDFASIAEAREALAALPVSLQVHAPWIRSFGDVQRSLDAN